MILFTNWKELKDIFEIHQRQKESYRPKKNWNSEKSLRSLQLRQCHSDVSFVERRHKILATQIKKRRERICETTLKLFIEQIHTIWNMSINKMITLLSMNVASAYNHVSRERLMHNLRKKEISNWIMTWTSNFMKNRHITLVIDDDTTFMSRVNADIWQKSSIFFFLSFL